MDVAERVRDRLDALLATPKEPGDPAGPGGPGGSRGSGGVEGAPRVERITGVGCGHAWSLHRARLSDGREVFVKAAHRAHGALTAEREGLRWLAAPGRRDGIAVPEALVSEVPVPEAPVSEVPVPEAPVPEAPAPEVPVPEVVAADDTMLVLPWIETGAPTAAAAERFGRELAALHARRPESYGAPWPGFIADLPLDNGPGEEWPAWYAERRLEPFLRAGHGVLGADGVRLVERVIERIADLAGPPQPPSRIHGDLWSGNLLWSADGSAEGRVMLIDPAAHGGHRETDLAMLTLFGAPMLDRILAAYHEAAPPVDGWRARIPLHQLHPLLVHVVLYGAGYRSSVMEAARRLLS